jgi:acid stress-induced BolA-like protein IbaG/YrbA
MDAVTIQNLIQTGLPDADVTVLGDDGQHFEATVICAQFEGKNMIQQHRMVYETLGALMGNEIHALALNTRSA